MTVSATVPVRRRSPGLSRLILGLAALIDLARRLGPRIGDLSRVDRIVIHTSHHTHHVIGTGANDPQKLDPKASRETLDHSIMYIFAVALEDGGWHHERSYAPERANRPETVALWHKITTVEDPEWTRRYHARDPREKAFGGRVAVTLRDGRVIEDELALADAHPDGTRPFVRENYVQKFLTLSDGIIATAEQHRFLDAVQGLHDLPAGRLTSVEMFREVRARLPGVKLLANMTEFGRTPALTAEESQELGYDMVIWPVSSLRVANKAQERLYAALARDGATTAMLPEMQTPGRALRRDRAQCLRGAGPIHRPQRAARAGRKRLPLRRSIRQQLRGDMPAARKGPDLQSRR